ncbi:HAD family phosphatase [Candidatus Beckwithbacteria bacterium]|nr:HAD family phosphatase [Candidatus Beckwithbacteria bacterium]
MSKYKAIVSDIDGTLTQINPNALPSEKVAESIKSLSEKGFTFSFATGRPFFLVEYLVNHLGTLGPCIVDNGAVIVDSKNGNILWEAILSPQKANQILKLSKDCQMVRASCDIGGIDNPKTIPSHAKVRKISIHDIDYDLAEQLINAVTETVSDVAAVKAASYQSDHLTDVYFSNIKATKQYAVFELAKLLHISPKEIIGIGDGYNDFPLLMACGLKVAMGNAVDELKEIADEIAPSVNEDGLAFIIEKYFL